MTTTFYARKELRIVDDTGAPVPNAYVRVRKETPGRPNAVLYAARDGSSVKGNPFQVDNEGKGFFYVDGGVYSILVYSTVTGYTDEVRYQGIGTMSELDQDQAVFGIFDAYDVTANLDDYLGQPEGYRVWCADAFDGDGGWYVRSDEPEASSGYYGPFSNKGPRGGDAYDVFFYDPDQPVSGEVLYRAPFTRVVTFSAGLEASKGRCTTAPTSEAVFLLMKNGVQFGTITFAAGETTAVFASASDATFDPDSNDELSIVAPTPKDPTLYQPRFTLSGYRPT